MPFDHRPDTPGADVLQSALVVLADKHSIDPESLTWTVGDRTDRKRSTLFHLTLRSPAGTVATAWYKTPYFPPGEQDSRHLGRAREALSRGDEMARHFRELAGESSLAINETLAFDEKTLEVVTLGLEGEPMGNPLQFAFTGKSRAKALTAAAAVGQAVRVLESFPQPEPGPELDRIWQETERKVESIGPLLSMADRRSLETHLGELFDLASADTQGVTVSHVDLSPGNVIMMEDGTGLIDFGWIPQLRGFDLSRFVHRLRYTTTSFRPWTASLVGAVTEGYGDAEAAAAPGWRFSEMQRLMGTIQRLERKGEGGRRSAGRALAEIRAGLT